MKIESLKDLKRLIQLCQTQGVKAITVDGIALELTDTPKHIASPRRIKQVSDIVNFPPDSIDETTQIPQMTIESDELSEEELMYYSVESSEAAQ